VSIASTSDRSELERDAAPRVELAPELRRRHAARRAEELLLPREHARLRGRAASPRATHGGSLHNDPNQIRDGDTPATVERDAALVSAT
jgi:hypothetical protein